MSQMKKERVRTKSALGFDPDPSLSGQKKNLEEILRSIYRGNCCRVLGPRYHNKSKLMRQAANAIGDSGTHYTIYIDLADVRRDNEARFYDHLVQLVHQQLPSSLNSVGVYHCQSAIEFQQALMRWTRRSNRNLVLLIDSLEMAPFNLAASLLGLLRAAFTSIVNTPGAHFQAIVCGSLDLNEVALTDASRFESISDLVLVTELDPEEREQLVLGYCRNAGIAPTSTGVRTLLRQTGGDPYLIREVLTVCFNKMLDQDRTRLTEPRVNEAVNLFLSTPVPGPIEDTLHQIEVSPSLLTFALGLLEHGTTIDRGRSGDTNELTIALDLCNAFRRVGIRFHFKSALWETFLRRHLSPARVGELFAIRGDWRRAVSYLGVAVSSGSSESVAKLFTTTINAIHASGNVTQAWMRLGDGLDALYPESDLRLYVKHDAALRQSYPLSDEPRRLLLLRDTHLPEIEALDGPEYSIANTESGTRLFFPLRSGSSRKQVVGLASCRRLTDSDSPYDQREARMQLAGFLRQAARAIEATTTYVQMLEASKRRSDKLYRLNQILTSLMSHRDRSEETLMRVLLEGITHGWGLEYNRALLFIPDWNEQLLRGHLAVGHLTRNAAEAQWENAPYDQYTDDEWIANLFSTSNTVLKDSVPLQSALRTVQVPLTAIHDPLVQSYHHRAPLRSPQYEPIFGFAPEFERIVESPTDFAIIPLRAGEGTLGVIYVDNRFTGKRVTDENYELLQIFVNQASLIIESARTLQRRTQELQELSRDLHSGLKSPTESDIEDVIRSTLQAARVRTGAPYLYLFRNQPFDKWRIYHLDDSDILSWRDVEKPPSARLLAIGATGDDLYDRSEPLGNALEFKFLHEDACCGTEMPVFVADNCMAVVHIESPVRLSLTVHRMEQLRHVTSRLALTLAQLQRIQALRQLVEISLGLTQEKDLKALLISIVERSMEAMRTVSAITLYYKDEATGQLRLGHMGGVRYKGEMSSYPPFRRTVAEEIFLSETPIFASEVGDHPLLNGPFVQREGIISAAAFPLRVGKNRVGCMFFNYRIHHVFDDSEQHILSLVAQLAAVAIHQADLNEEIRRRELWERISRLSTGMIHDINSAVASIPGLVAEIDMKLSTGNDVSAPLADLERNAHKTGQLSARLREYVIRQDFSIEMIQLDGLIRTALQDLDAHRPPNVTLRYCETGSLPPIQADGFLLDQLLRNLIANAWAAIPSETPGCVDIRTETTAQRVRIIVKDNGRGIAEKDASRIFDPDFTTKADSFGLHGIGLAYCKQIAKEHGGNLVFESRLNEGTTFTLELPHRPGQEEYA